MVPSIKHYVAVLAIPALGFAALLSAAQPAPAATLGLTASCSFISTTRAQCNFPVLSAEFNSEIHYISAQCNSTGVAFNLKQLEILAIPPNGTSDVAYETAGNRSSEGGVANTGGDVVIAVKVDTTSAALIDFAAAPTGRTSCTVSLTATY